MNRVTPVIETAHQASGRAIPAWLRRFYEAFLLRDERELDAVLDERVDWLLEGPAEQFDHYGRRHGKRAVIELITRIMPCYYQPAAFSLDCLLIQGDASHGNVATRIRMRARQRDTGRALSLRSAQFIRFKGGLLTWFRAVPETFDAIEQMVGRSIDVSRAIETDPTVPRDLSLAPDGGAVDDER